MRQFFNYAIDLGTTNSCIAKFEDKEPRIFKNIDGMETIPSAVYVNKNGRIIVGKGAIDKSASNPDDTAFEFKRLMGTKHSQLFKTSGAELTPVELSAEVLKTLKDEVYRINGEVVENVVVTVPTAFNSLQCEATYEAAKLAGFTGIVLLQEPIAATMGYNVDATGRNIYMVFDFGGGTLDVAIILVINRNLRVINNEGNNFLGSKDIDRAIVDDVIIPELAKKYKIDSRKNEIPFTRRLLKYAEEAKKTLLTRDEYILDIFEIGKDDVGSEMDIQISINCDTLNDAAMPIIKSCIDVANKAINDAGIEKEDIKEILLVGGGTYLQSLRNELKNHFVATINTTQNPMTIVAKGAAIYSSSLYVRNEENTDEISVQIEYDNMVSGSSCNVMGKVLNSNDIKGIKVVRDIDKWSSDWHFINELIFEIDLELKENVTNEFQIILRNFKNEEIIPQGGCFKILSKADSVKLVAPLLPHSLSLELDDETGTKLTKMLYKNTPIPARKIQTFRTVRELIPGTEENLTIKLWEGESEDIGLCEWIGNIYISGEDIIYPIPANTEIEIDVSIDISRRISIDLCIEYSDVFKSDTKLYNYEPLDISKPMGKMKSGIQEIINQLSVSRGKFDDDFGALLPEIDDLIARAHALYLENHELLGMVPIDTEGVCKLMDKIKGLKNDFNNIYKETLRTEENVVKEDKGHESNRIEINVEKYGSEKDKSCYEELKKLLKESQREKDRKGEKLYRQKVKELHDNICRNNIDFWYDYLKMLKIFRLSSSNTEEFDMWVSKGEEAKNNDSIEGVLNALGGLLNLINKSDLDTVAEQFLPPGIRE